LVGLIFVVLELNLPVMKSNYLILGLVSCFLSLFSFACERTDVLPPNHAKGKIIAVTSLCYGEIVLIEVEKPKGIGVKDTFSTLNKDVDISYENAISVPYFSKIGLPNSIPQLVGTELFFMYRELTTEEWESGHLFEPGEPTFCTMNIGPPNSKPLIITRVLSYD
jgi:hypothetical protein